MATFILEPGPGLTYAQRVWCFHLHGSPVRCLFPCPGTYPEMNVIHAHVDIQHWANWCDRMGIGAFTSQMEMPNASQPPCHVVKYTKVSVPFYQKFSIDSHSCGNWQSIEPQPPRARAPNAMRSIK